MAANSRLIDEILQENELECAHKMKNRLDPRDQQDSFLQKCHLIEVPIETRVGILILPESYIISM